MTGLNIGKGRCRGTARLTVTPSRAAVEFGSSVDVLARTLNGIHHLNRHADPDDFLAVTLPGIRKGRSVLLPGHEIQVLGSEAALQALIDLDGFAALRKRGAIVQANIEEVTITTGETGAAFIRDRACEKRSAGWARRAEARALRKGFEWRPPSQKRGPGTVSLQYGQKTLHVRPIIGEITDAPLMVSTYGFSGAAAPAVLPVRFTPERSLAHAA